jgi:hypothetical protein
MLLIIFGAGASCDSVYGGDWPKNVDKNYQPPLASQLFENRPNFGAALMNFPPARPLVARMREAIGQGKDVEEVLEEVQALAEQGNEHLFSQLMALKMYLQVIIRDCTHRWLEASYGISNYSRLLDKIEIWRRREHEPVLLITFNYDSILESACGDVVGFHISDMGQYVARDDYKLIHLHGSIGWGRVTNLARSDVPGHSGPMYEVLPRDLIANAAAVQMTDRFVIGPPAEEERMAVAPAIAIPFRAKSAFECPAEHLEAMQTCLPDVDRVLIVGWRGQEMHFLNVWRDLLNPEIEGLLVSENQASAEATATFVKETLGIEHLFPSAARGFSSLARDDSLLSRVLEKRLQA